MQIRITRAFLPPDSPRPFLPQELVTVPDATAKEWIDEGKATPHTTGLPATPPKHKRERATR